MKDYRIVRRKTSSDLSQEVVILINKGWTTAGGAFQSNDGMFCQTMVLNIQQDVLNEALIAG